MPIRVAEIDPAPAGAMVDPPVLARMRFTAIDYACRLYAAKDRIEFRFAHLECIVMGVKLLDIIVEIQRESLIDPHRRKIAHGLLVEAQSEQARKKFSRRDLVM